MSPSVKKLWQWINTRIASPRKAIGGHSVCPVIKDYLDQIMIVEDTDPAQVIENFITFRTVFNLEAVVVVGIDWDFDTLTDWCEAQCEKYKKQDIEVLGMAPDTVEPPLPLKYNYHRPLVIIQNRSTLLDARRLVAKTTDYYTYYQG